MKFNMSKCLEAFSLALDFAEMDYLNVTMHHSRRIAYISLTIGRVLNLSDENIKDLFVLALLHDNGLTLAGLKLKNLVQMELLPDHCIEGEKNIESFPLYKRRKNVILYHHENYNGSGLFKISEENIPLFSQIIRLADDLDMKFNISQLKCKEREEVISYVSNNRKKLFSPKVVDAFLSISHKERFWLDLSFYSIIEVLNRITPQIIYDYSWEDIIPISKTFMRIIDSKSKFTSNHSKGITEKVRLMSDYYNFDHDKKIKLNIATNLHDLGKLYITNAILEKPEKLNVFEFSEIKKHTYYTKLALNKIDGFEDIANWAGNHHEKLNGKGYPESLCADEIDFESRLVGVIDIYQALTEERPYRKGSSHKEAMKIIHSMADNGFIDKQITEDVDLILNEN